MNVFHSTFDDNAGTGLQSNGGASTVRISDNEVIGNVTGLAGSNTGVFRSLKNNFVDGNGTDIGGGTVINTVTPAKKAKKSHKRRGAYR
jgi:hypothetical protein